MRRLVYGPPNWLVTKLSAEDRRAFGFWTIVAAATGAVFFGRTVLYVTILSVVALIPNYTSETPVETEGDRVSEGASTLDDVNAGARDLPDSRVGDSPHTSDPTRR